MLCSMNWSEKMPTSALWQACWQGTLLALGVWLVCRLFPKLPASARATLWWLVSLKLLVCFIPLPNIGIPLLPEESVSSGFGPTGGMAAPVTRLSESTQAVQSLVVSAPEMRSSNWLPSILVALWMLGILVLVIRYARHFVEFRQMVRQSHAVEDPWILQTVLQMSLALGLRRAPRARIAATAQSPMLVGFWKPIVLMPRDIATLGDRREVDMLIAHELAHVKRRDTLAAWVPWFANLIFFFLPTVWIANREWDTEREAACDALALEVSGASRADYGRLLMRLASASDARDPSMAMGATAQFHTLRKRLIMIKKKPSSNPRLRAIAIGLIAITSLMVIPWQVTAAAQTQEIAVAIKTYADQKPGYWKLDVKIPLFTDNGKVAALANADAENLTKEYDGFLKAAKERVAKYDVKYGFSLTRRAEVTVARKNLISYYWVYEMCPDYLHPVQYQRAGTYGIVAGKAKKLTINDLFKPGVDGDYQVSKVVYERLKDIFPRQYTKDSTMPDNMIDRHIQFSLASDHLMVHYQKEGMKAAGRTSDGLPLADKYSTTYSLKVPYSDLEGLDPKGPLAELLR